MNDRIELLEQRLHEIEARNKRVEADKAWETSWFRVLSVAAITYMIALGVFYAIGNDHVFRNALVPTIGFCLSTLSLPAIKSWWITGKD
jgi:hypothetical protein